MSGIPRGSQGCAVIKSRTVGPMIPPASGVRFNLKKWRHKTVIAAGLTMDAAKAAAREWNVGKPTSEWVILVPAR